ncbi:MAG: hypothetical protein M1831_005623 [Alyxoria varia]|nr:MAG: hypothetical protein M1831_005623 [Alyxoria varia]
MNLYMGKRSTDRGGWISGTNYQRRIQSNIANQQTLHSGGPWQAVAHFYCDKTGGAWPEKDRLCENQLLAATTWETYGVFWASHYILFCQPFFGLQTLGQVVNNAKYDLDARYDIERMMNNKAGAVFHETWHWPWTVSNPMALDISLRTEKPVYGPEEVAENAAAPDGDAPITSRIADAYSVVGHAIFLMRKFGMETPPSPIPPNGTTVTRADLATLRDSSDRSPPPGFVDSFNLSDPNGEPDPKVWKPIGSLPPLDEELYGKWQD